MQNIIGWAVIVGLGILVSLGIGIATFLTFLNWLKHLRD
jgi:hypothetical protein